MKRMPSAPWSVWPLGTGMSDSVMATRMVPAAQALAPARHRAAPMATAVAARRVGASQRRARGLRWGAAEVGMRGVVMGFLLVGVRWWACLSAKLISCQRQMKK